jgi:hypothetical protein
MDLKLLASAQKDWERQEALEVCLQHLDTIMAVAVMPSGERFFHEKRGTTYDVYGVGHANSAREFDVITPGFHRGVETRLKGKKILFDRDEVVIYRDVQSGAFSVRGKDEFLDGRFTPLPRLPGQPLPDPARALVERVDDGSASPITNGQPPRPATVETGTQRVKYSGPTVRLRGQEGSVVSWIGGNLMVDWDDKRAMEGLATINAFNVTEIGDVG